MQGASQKICAGEVQPKMKRPAAKKTEPIIMGGRRGFGNGSIVVSFVCAGVELVVSENLV